MVPDIIWRRHIDQLLPTCSENTIAEPQFTAQHESIDVNLPEGPEVNSETNLPSCSASKAAQTPAVCGTYQDSASVSSTPITAPSYSSGNSVPIGCSTSKSTDSFTPASEGAGKAHPYQESQGTREAKSLSLQNKRN